MLGCHLEVNAWGQDTRQHSSHDGHVIATPPCRHLWEERLQSTQVEGGSDGGTMVMVEYMALDWILGPRRMWLGVLGGP